MCACLTSPIPAGRFSIIFPIVTSGLGITLAPRIAAQTATESRLLPFVNWLREKVRAGDGNHTGDGNHNEYSGTISGGIAKMELPPFLLDRWIEQRNHANPPIEFDLASSTGPVWTLRELLALSPENDFEELLDTRISYTSAAGTVALRTAVAELEGVE